MMKRTSIAFKAYIHKSSPSWEEVKSILGYFEGKSNWPRPIAILFLDREEVEQVQANSYMNPNAEVAFRRLGPFQFPIHYEMEGGGALILDTDVFSSYWGGYYLFNENTKHQLRRDLEEYVDTVQPIYTYLILDGKTSILHDSHFPHQTIVPHSGILSWLHYFSPAAIEENKLERLFNNPHLTVTPIGEGHLFQVLEDPFEINTPEGEAKVIAANQWMLDH